MYIVSGTRNDARRWVTDSKFAVEISERLVRRGHDPESIHARAYERCASELRQIEDNIAKREARRRATLVEIVRWDERFAKRLDKASLEILDGEFSEAAE